MAYQNKKNNRIIFLDYMRIFAFLSVLVCHEFYDSFEKYSHDETLHITLRYLASTINFLSTGGVAGVVVFFLISGYIITNIARRETSKNFLIKRFFRIYPLFIFAIVSEFILAWIYKNQEIPNLITILKKISLLGDFFKEPYSLGGVEWTLRIEIMFYILIAIMNEFNFLKNKYLVLITFSIITILLYIVGPITNFHDGSRGYVSLYMPFLFLGSLLYLLEVKVIKNSIFYIFLILTIYLYCLFLPKFNILFMNTNAALFGVLIFLVSYYFRKKFTDNKIILLLSILTYSIYIFHAWLWSYLINFILTVDSGPNEKIKALFLLLLICYTLSKYIERPFIYFGIKFQKHKSVT